MSRDKPPLPNEPQVIRQGYLRRLKTMKRKYFVLKSESKQSSARLEYYDSEKKFRAKVPPKRAIPLKSCFNINRRLDTKHKHVIALYTKEEGFCIVLDSEDDLRSWLNALITLHHGDEDSDDHQYPKQHVWKVNVQKKGLGASKSILGLYNLCLTEKTVSLTKIKSNNNIVYDTCIPDHLEFSLRNIRRCGNSECFFYMEVGRQTVTGAGELWMHTDDNNIASSMHTTILGAMSNCTKESNFFSATRDRSMSVNDATKPLGTYNRRQTADGRMGLSPSNEKGFFNAGMCARFCIKPSDSAASCRVDAINAVAIDDSAGVRNRCDSMPARVCSRDSDAERVPSRVPSQHLEDVGEMGCDMVDGVAEWAPATHQTPRIPEEPDQAYCEMNPPPPCRIKTNNSTHHSRNSSLAEDASPVEGYLSMAPRTLGVGSGDTGYVDMHAHRAASPAASASSVASGTPSTDLRFSEYHLEPVSAKILLEDEEKPIPRAYSVGSRPTPTSHSRATQDTSRKRAFSVGSKTKMRPIGQVPPQTSTPHLTPRPSAETLCDNLMWLDFSHNQSSPKTRPPVAGVPRTPPTGAGFSTHITSTPRPNATKVDEYVDMSPSGIRVPGYIEMRPSEQGPTSTEVPLARSPPSRNNSTINTAPATPAGYVEMNYGKRPDVSRPSSRPIQIFSDSNRHGLSRLAMTTDHEQSSSRATPLLLLQSGGRNGPVGSRNVKKTSERQRRNSKDSGTPINAQTIFSLSLDSPASPSRPPEDDKEFQVEDLFDDSHYAEVVGTTLSTVREINEDGTRKSQDLAESPSDYVVLKSTSESTRAVSQPIAARSKVDSSTREAEALLSSNPTATKTLARETAVIRVEDARPALARGPGGGGRFGLAEEEQPARKSSSPKPGGESALNRALRGDGAATPPLNYASLDLEPRSGAPPSPTPASRPYTQIDFALSEKLNNPVDTN